jgi:SAM-dependent methyltransferase
LDKKIDSSYEEKKVRERKWYSQKGENLSFFQTIFHNPLIYSLQRIVSNYIYPKEQMAAMVRRRIDNKVDKLLIAPCGRGDDAKYLNGIASHIFGVDITFEALRFCPENLYTANVDILYSPYPDETFDIIVIPLFFHHMLKFGFLPFLQELHRILRPGGSIVILEPSKWYPLNIITRPIKRLFNNPFDEVEDEDPFPPGQMIYSLKESGFSNREFQAATFSHPAFYKPIARLVNYVGSPFLRVWPFKYFGWLVIYWGEKAKNTPYG